MRIRQAGRVIVLDPDGRVLLMAYDGGLPVGRHWATPGGGVDPGESFAEAAARELTEETGWTDVPLGEQVYENEFIVDYGDHAVHHHQCFFLARVAIPGREVADVDGMHGADGIAAWRWWSIPELDTTTEVIWPIGLTAVIRNLPEAKRR
jgi:ADP-ribose pyrophosphatase YjhB (NUDIX family)